MSRLPFTGIQPCADADLTRAIYQRVPVLVNKQSGENPWGVRFLRMLDMSNDSHLFRTRPELEQQGFRLEGNRFINDEQVWLPPRGLMSSITARRARSTSYQTCTPRRRTTPR